eukprot:NODE_2036_length_1219_cov_8.103419_g1690_i0.p1 GENE.NODE_2036_length_1219_cov_8.103419_g1690_i0~~NODE_2036_length_1219_cov_8.103419_g1690_i0.p1  ORF type:complete len:356 (-),score=74.90 NODE_2036_length_1219_cov_8.103419_g1690_i0:150-1100(-)
MAFREETKEIDVSETQNRIGIVTEEAADRVHLQRNIADSFRNQLHKENIAILESRRQAELNRSVAPAPGSVGAPFSLTYPVTAKKMENNKNWQQRTIPDPYLRLNYKAPDGVQETPNGTLNGTIPGSGHNNNVAASPEQAPQSTGLIAQISATPQDQMDLLSIAHRQARRILITNEDMARDAIEHDAFASRPVLPPPPVVSLPPPPNAKLPAAVMTELEYWESRERMTLTENEDFEFQSLLTRLTSNRQRLKSRAKLDRIVAAADRRLADSLEGALPPLRPGSGKSPLAAAQPRASAVNQFSPPPAGAASSSLPRL